MTSEQVKGMTYELMEKLRKKCVADVKHIIGNIRYDRIYAFQHGILMKIPQMGNFIMSLTRRAG